MTGTNDVLGRFERAVAFAQDLIGTISTAELSAPTPCTEWDIRAVIGHLNDQIRPAAGLAHEGFTRNDGDPRSEFAAVSDAALATFRAPGALERAYPMPWGETDGEQLTILLAADLTMHGWDLAKATGRSTVAIDPELCEAALAFGRAMMKPEFRTPQAGFGPEIPVPADAPACERMAGFFGRQP